MKVCLVFAAALAAGSMISVCFAEDVNKHENSTAQDLNTSGRDEIFDRAVLGEAPYAAAGEISAGQSTDAVPALQIADAEHLAAVGVLARARAAGKQERVKEAKEAGLPFHAIVSRYAALYGVPAQLAHAVIRIESNYRVTARGRAGEVGLMQIKPSTARQMGYSGSAEELYHPETNIKYGMKYLGEAFRLGGGDTCGAILRYNAGHGAKRMNRVSSAYCLKIKRILGQG